MNIDYEIWNAMSTEEKKAYIESLPPEPIFDGRLEKASEWANAATCAIPIAVGLLALVASLILFTP